MYGLEKHVCCNPKCGKTFYSRRKNQKYCSSNCAAEARYRPKIEPKTCPKCGKTFEPTDGRQRWCLECRDVLAKEKEKNSTIGDLQECEYCHRAFFKNTHNQKFCSSECHENYFRYCYKKVTKKTPKKTPKKKIIYFGGIGIKPLMTMTEDELINYGKISARLQLERMKNEKQ